MTIKSTGPRFGDIEPPFNIKPNNDGYAMQQDRQHQSALTMLGVNQPDAFPFSDATVHRKPPSGPGALPPDA